MQLFHIANQCRDAGEKCRALLVSQRVTTLMLKEERPRSMRHRKMLAYAPRGATTDRHSLI